MVRKDDQLPAEERPNSYPVVLEGVMYSWWGFEEMYSKASL